MTAAHQTSLSAKEQILRRIREALPGDPIDPSATYDRVQRRYPRVGLLAHEQSEKLFIERLLDYDTEIVQINAEAKLEIAIAGAVAEALGKNGEFSLLAPVAFPPAWLPVHCKIILDAQLTTQQLVVATAVVTTCEAATASTGTIFLVHSGMQGRRALTLLPDHHICLVRRDQIYETVAEAIEAVAPHSAKPMTTISGPSATSDIEMTRIRGVHGPRRLTVILYGNRPSDRTREER